MWYISLFACSNKNTMARFKKTYTPNLRDLCKRCNIIIITILKENKRCCIAYLHMHLRGIWRASSSPLNLQHMESIQWNISFSTPHMLLFPSLTSLLSSFLLWTLLFFNYCISKFENVHLNLNRNRDVLSFVIYFLFLTWIVEEFVTCYIIWLDNLNIVVV